MLHADSKIVLVLRAIAGLLAVGFTAYALLLLGTAIADRAIALLFAVAAGIAAIPCWWLALRGLAVVQRWIIGLLAILFTAYTAPVVWLSIAHRSPGGLLLGFVSGIIAIPCWRFAFREKRSVSGESSN